MPKAWRRTASAFGGGGIPVIPPATVIVESVTANGDGTATWVFSKVILGTAQTQALSIASRDPVTDQGAFGGTDLVVTYADTPVSGDDWSVDSALLGPCFVGGDSLVPGQSGIVG